MQCYSNLLSLLLLLLLPCARYAAETRIVYSCIYLCVSLCICVHVYLRKKTEKLLIANRCNFVWICVMV